MLSRACVPVLLVAMAAAPVARGQSVRGTVADNSGRMLGGVIVALVDSAQKEIARVLTSERGEYRLTAPQGGTYRLRAIRVGFRPTLSGPVIVAARGEVSQPLVLSQNAFALDTVRAVSRSACRVVARDSTSTVAAVWEQVRNALLATQLTLSTRTIQATTLAYERTLDPRSQRVGQQSLDVRTDFAHQPWKSLSADSLRRVGYVYTAAGDVRTYNAPGLDVLLSEQFLEDHCLKIASGSSRERLGIDFEPTDDRKKFSEVRGTVWLDRATSELREMDYRYVNNISPDEERSAGGTIGFTRMTNGMWAISRWSIRAPTIVLVPSYRQLKIVGYDARVDSVKVTGGELVLAVLSSSRGRDTIWKRPSVALRGVVLDSLTSRPIPRSIVSLSGTVQADTTDAAGEFSISGVLPGRYSVEVRTPSLDSMNVVDQRSIVFADTSMSLTVRVGNASSIMSTLCGGASTATRRGNGLILGTVFAGDTTPAPNVNVSVEWTEVVLTGIGASSRAEDQVRSINTRTDPRGVFRVCGLPINRAVKIRASTDSAQATPHALTIPDGQRFARAELVLNSPIATTGSFGGFVVDSAMKPLTEVEVTLADLGLTTKTDSTGAFRFPEIVPGSHRVVVRRIGFGALDAPLDIKAGEETERKIVLSQVTVLEEMKVEDKVLLRESPFLREFEANRKLGLGRFFTRADLEVGNGRSTATFLEMLPGFSTISSGGARYVKSIRGITSLNVTCWELQDATGPIVPSGGNCGCFPLIFLDGVKLGGTNEVPNINRFRPEDLESIEVYRNAAQTPPRYAVMNSQCGVIVLHSRRPVVKKDKP